MSIEPLRTPPPPPPPFRAARLGGTDPRGEPVTPPGAARAPSREPKGRARPATWRTFFGKEEFRWLLMMLLTVTCAWGFVHLGQLVSGGHTDDFDTTVLLALRDRMDTSDPIGPRWVEEIARDMTALGGIGVVTGLTLVSVGLLGMSGRRHAAWLVAIAVVGATLMSMFLKDSYDRPRPDLVPHGSIVYTRSFPSGHSMLAAVTYLTIAVVVMRLLRRRTMRFYVLAIAAFVTASVGVSRVYLGVHWPSDVLAGWVAGTGWASLVWIVARFLQRRGAIEQPSDSLVVP